MNKPCVFVAILLSVVALFTQQAPVFAADTVTLSKGQTIYVPAYSHIYMGSREREILLAVTLSLRNTDAKHAITLTSVDYFGTKGERIKKYLERPVVLKPFESTRYIVPQKDKSGGSGANFIVAWDSKLAVNPPLFESVMIGVDGPQSVSFTSRGQEISNEE